MLAANSSEKTFSRWLSHRSQLIGACSLTRLADLSGVNLSTLEAIAERGSLDGADRSARAWLARALKVPLKEMESFAEGAAPPIPDWRMVDLDRPGGGASARVQFPDADSCPRPITAPAGRGIPIVGRVICSDRIIWDDSNPPESRRMRISYRGLTDLFALSVEDDLAPDAGNGESLIFRNVLPAHLSRGDCVLFTFSDGTTSGQSRLGWLTAGQDGAAMLMPFGSAGADPIALRLETLVRAARLFARVGQDRAV